MPLTRYQIRNEFNLADPELYRAADRDDPEALLDGVAMAGFVGLLRQLGDLAEFAAEVFHDLHEEVMATAARGHGLMDRIQQLEADVPLIEKNLLSRTNHTTFYHNTGVDWHPQMCTDQNLITQGDMPRFIRDSYEECRGPPQLFLLDKFDIGGAGACLKRYTDPSSFKAEQTASEEAKLGVQRDRRIRKIKKKGSHGKNGDTPEVFSTSHAKLHQLLLEERIGNDSKDSSRHVKLKKRILNVSNSGNSYMEKFLKTMSPNHSDEIKVGQPVLRLTYNHIDGSEREIFDIQPVSATKDSHYFAQNGQEMKLRPSAMYSYDFSKSRRSKGSTASIEDGSSVGTASPLHIPVTENDLGVDGDYRNGNGNISPYHEATVNEAENYMDALANMESEAETDNEYIPKKELRYFSKHAGVYDSKGQILDSQSVDNSIISDEGSISFVKGASTSTSSSHGAPLNEEHSDREVESSHSLKTYEAVVVDHLDSFDYSETEKISSNRYLKANGKTIGSIATPYNYEVGDISYQKDSSCMLQSFDTGLSSRHLSSAGAHFNTAPSEAIYDPEHLQLERTRVSGGAFTTLDGPFEVDNISVKKAYERHVSEVPNEALLQSSKNISHFVSSGAIENDTLQMGCVDDFSAEKLANEEVVLSQSATDTQLQDFEQGYQERDGRSHKIRPVDDTIDSHHVFVSEDENVKPAIEENVDGYNHVMNTGGEKVENGAAALLGVYGCDNGGLYTLNRGLAATELFSETCNTEGLISSDELLSQGFPGKGVQRESDSGGTYDFGQAVLPAAVYLLPANTNSDEEVPYWTDSVTQQAQDLQTEKEVSLEGDPSLPPLQWVNGKPQDSFFDAGEESAEFITASSGLLPSSTFDLKGSIHFTALDSETKQLLIATEPDESLQNTSGHHPGGLPLSTESSSEVKDAIEEHGEQGLYMTADTKEAAQSSVPLLGNMTTDTEDIIQPRPAEHTVLSSGETIQTSAIWQSPQPPLGDLSFSASEVPALSAEKSLEESFSYRTKDESVEEKIIKPPEVPSPTTKNEEHHKQQMKSSERQASWSLALLNYEDEKLAEKPALKPPRPRNPLIESIGALDRSKLRKVTTQNRPKPPAVEERESILEQIRTKSFKLKPAPAPVLKPIIRTPTMNLKVAAILEKANKIRRATAGSDEDDEDDWSDY